MTEACQFCGGATRPGLTGRNRRDGLDVTGRYLECTRCGHRTLEPMPTQEQLGEYYRCAGTGRRELTPWPEGPAGFSIRVAGKLNSFLRASELEHAAAHRYVPADPAPGARVLDLGGGNGEMLGTLAQQGYRLCGTDISADHVETCARRFPDGEFWCDSLTEPVACHERFAFARLDNVLEHMLAPIEVLRNAAGLLSPGGELAVYVPSGESLSLRLLRSASITHWVPFHLNLFSERSLRLAMELAGLSVRFVRKLTPPTWWFLSMAQLLGVRSDGSPVGAHRLAMLHLAAWPFRVAAATAPSEELWALGYRQAA